jgi:hypothetical protein
MTTQKFYGRVFSETLTLERFVDLNEIQQHQIVSITYKGEGRQSLYFFTEGLKYDFFGFISVETINTIEKTVIEIDEGWIQTDLKTLSDIIQTDTVTKEKLLKELEELNGTDKSTLFTTGSRLISVEDKINMVKVGIRSCENRLKELQENLEEVKGCVYGGYYTFKQLKSGVLRTDTGFSYSTLLPVNVSGYDGVRLKETLEKINPESKFGLEWKRVQKDKL